MHLHPFTAAPHFHPINIGSDMAFGFDYYDYADYTVVAGATNSENNLQLYHAKTLIMYDGRLR